MEKVLSDIVKKVDNLTNKDDLSKIINDYNQNAIPSIIQNNVPIVIKQNLYPLPNNRYNLDIVFCLEVCSNGSSGGLLLLDTLQAELSESSPFIIEDVKFCGNRCNDGYALIHTDHKSVDILFPNFYVSSINNCKKECCKMSLIFDASGFDICNEYELNIIGHGQALLAQGSQSDFLTNCINILTMNGPYAQNYEVDITIKGDLANCTRGCSCSSC